MFKAKMKNHTILVGWNKTAEATLEELKKISKVCVVSENQELVKQIKGKNVLRAFAGLLRRKSIIYC